MKRKMILFFTVVLVGVFSSLLSINSRANIPNFSEDEYVRQLVYINGHYCCMNNQYSACGAALCNPNP